MKIIITESQHRFLTLQSWVDQLEKVIANFDKIDCEEEEDYFKYKIFCEHLPNEPLEKLIRFKEELEKEINSMVYHEFQSVLSKKN